jgi:hypothetical protein
MAEKSFKQYKTEAEKTLELYLVKKAPALPKDVKEFIVKVAPYLVILGVVLAIPAILALFGLGAFLSVMPFGAFGVAKFGIVFMLGMAFLMASVILELLAFPGLKDRKKQGWDYIFYSVILSAVHSLLTGSLVGLVVGTAISLYVVFQVREYYK